MSATSRVAPVKQFVAVLWARPDALEQALDRLVDVWGTIDYQGKDKPFDMTDYYQPEMGPHLHRRLVSFARLVAPESLVDAKLRCNQIDRELADDGRRRVNLDIGYLDHNKVVLGSVKYAGQKIHLGRGIYADMIARYRDGAYRPFQWTFPDFRDGRYDEDLLAMRRRYLQQLREARSG